MTDNSKTRKTRKTATAKTEAVKKERKTRKAVTENNFANEPSEKFRIQIAAKGYRNQSKNYPSTVDMLNELATNQFFAPNVANIRMEFDTDENGGSFAFINDGEPMGKKEMQDAVGTLGCYSANTAGNENGIGIKSAAAYATRYYNDSILVVVSKHRGKGVSCYAINSNGECCTYTACTKGQQGFIDEVCSKFKSGTATAVYKTKITEDDVMSFVNDIPYMFTTGLDKVRFTYSINSGEDVRIKSFDRLYLSADSEGIIRVGDDVSFKHTVKVNTDGCIEYRTRKFFCTYQAVYMESVPKKLRDHRDAGTADFGVHIGYDNGYMPIHIPNVESIGLASHSNFCHFRAAIIAHPVEKGEMYYEYNENNEKVLVENLGLVAGIEEWQALIGDIGNVNAQKVPNLSKRKGYIPNAAKSKSKTPKKCWEGFYYAVVSNLVACANEWKEDSGYVKKSDKFKDSELEKANKHLQKLDVEHFGSLWKFRFAKNLGTKTVKYEKANKTILFNFTDKSELNQKLLNGGRKGRNGSTDLYISIEPIIDVFKMNILASTNHTSADIEKSIRVTRDRFNSYYATEEND